VAAGTVNRAVNSAFDGGVAAAAVGGDGAVALAGHVGPDPVRMRLASSPGATSRTWRLLSDFTGARQS